MHIINCDLMIFLMQIWNEQALLVYGKITQAYPNQKTLVMM